MADEGILSTSARSQELLSVIRQYGDPAMEFIWKNKGALAVASMLKTFLADPQAYISGTAELAGAIAGGINWTLIVTGILSFMFLPLIARSLLKTRRIIKDSQSQ